MPMLVEYPTSRAESGAEPQRRDDGLLHYRGLTPCLTELLDLRVHRYPNREAVVELDPASGLPMRSMTYRELWASASRVAGGLQLHGIGYGDRVAIQLPNGVAWLQAFLGALLSGAVPVPVNPALGQAEVSHVLGDSAVDFVLDGILPDGTAFIDDGACLSELALLCYTRGRSGMPKGVELSNENLLSAVESVIAAEQLPDDGIRNLVLLPLAHASGCVDQVLPTLAVGGTVVVAAQLDVRRLRRVLHEQRIDALSAHPSIYRALTYSAALAGFEHRPMRRICCAGGSLAHSTSLALRAAFPAATQWSWWGATETSGVGLMLSEELASSHPGCTGSAFGGTELALWGPAAEHGIGELLCRGPTVMRGYWRDPETTARQFTDKWFHTGDQVSIDADGVVRIASGSRSPEESGAQPVQHV